MWGVGHNNTGRSTKFSVIKLFFHIITTISDTFLPTMNKSLHVVIIKICTCRSNPLFTPIAVAITESHYLPLCSHPLFGLRKHSASVDEFFSAYRSQMICLCYIHIFMSDTILLDCHSALICNKTKKLVLGE